MKKLFLIIAFTVLLFAPLGARTAFGCSTHGSPDNIIFDWEVTPGSAVGQFEIRLKNFNTLSYSPSEMCSCGLQILSSWNIVSAKLVLSGTDTPVASFPTFNPDSLLSTELESLFPTSVETEWIALKNTINPPGSGGGDTVDLVFTGIFPDTTKMEIQNALQNKLVTVGKVNSQGTGFDLDHFESLTIFQPAIGGIPLSIQTSSLILAGAHLTASWLLPVLVAGTGIILARKMF